MVKFEKDTIFKEGIKTKGTIKFTSQIIGDILVPDITYDKIGESQLFYPDEGNKIVKYVRNLEMQAINEQPIKDFISAKETAKKLGITTTQLANKQRFKSGLIMYTTIDNKRFYIKKSVELYKQTKNGRFKLKCSFQ